MWNVCMLQSVGLAISAFVQFLGILYSVLSIFDNVWYEYILIMLFLIFPGIERKW